MIYPAYYVANLSAFYQHKNFEIDLNIDNLFDKLYFTPDADTYLNMGGPARASGGSGASP